MGLFIETMYNSQCAVRQRTIALLKALLLAETPQRSVCRSLRQRLPKGQLLQPRGAGISSGRSRLGGSYTKM